MSEPLAERFPELMLPGAGAIAPDGVLLVESDPAFVEAFLVGANQELNYELLWRRPARGHRARRRFAGSGDTPMGPTTSTPSARGTPTPPSAAM